MKKFIIGLGNILIGITLASIFFSYEKKNILEKQENKVNKYHSYYNILNQWLYLKQENKSIITYFKKYNYNNIAIYGMGELGNRLLNDLKNSDIQIKYCLDSNLPAMDKEQNPIKNIELEDLDAIIVTAVFAFDEIKKKLENTVACPIISLKDIIVEI